MAKLLSNAPERLHHHAYVVKDQEKNRQFFEDVLGIPLTATWCEKHFNHWVGREVAFCHTFYSLGDGLIENFYASRLNPAQKLRILVGKPPVPIHVALRYVAEKPIFKMLRGD